MQPLKTNSTFVRDSDFNLSLTHMQSMTSQVTQQELQKGDVLYSDCKDAFLDLQKFKNENNA